MLLAPRYFVAFLDGRLGETQRIAFVPGDLGAHIHAYSPHLTIGRTYALKLQRKHSLKYEQFQLVQPAIEHGYAGIHRGDLVFLYFHEETRRWFLLAVKTAAAGAELWLKSFYPLDAKRTGKIRRQMTMLREHA